jgi:hypothetical protein
VRGERRHVAERSGVHARAEHQRHVAATRVLEAGVGGRARHRLPVAHAALLQHAVAARLAAPLERRTHGCATKLFLAFQTTFNISIAKQFYFYIKREAKALNLTQQILGNYLIGFKIYH